MLYENGPLEVWPLLYKDAGFLGEVSTSNDGGVAMDLSGCSRTIAPEDTFVVSDDHLAHLDCKRPQA
jgi:hypothetical protein